MNDIRQLKVLTGFRFFAALHVVCFHNLYLFGDLKAVPAFFLKFIQAGEAAVSFFFILSGFILTHVYNQKLVTPTERTHYFISRLAKLYPLYFLGMVLDFPRVIHYFFSTNDTGVAALKASASGIAYLLMLQSWFPPLATAWNPPAWSLSCEIFFYIAFIFAMKTFFLSENRLRDIVVCYSIPLLLFAFCSQVVDIKSSNFTVGWMTFPLLRIFEFFIGISLYGFVGAKSFISRWVRKKSSLVFWLSLTASVGLTYFYESPVDGKIFSHLLLVPLFCAMILSASYDEIYLKSIFTNASTYYLGLSSYAIYILHQPIKNYFSWMEPSLALGSLYFVALLGLCCLAHKFVESPLQKIISQRLKAQLMLK
jgi:peptidoglycan/LPS O-acetylase OafA/YrhL